MINSPDTVSNSLSKTLFFFFFFLQTVTKSPRNRIPAGRHRSSRRCRPADDANNERFTCPCRLCTFFNACLLLHNRNGLCYQRRLESSDGRNPLKMPIFFDPTEKLQPCSLVNCQSRRYQRRGFI